jgi:hypothetical protein
MVRTFVLALFAVALAACGHALETDGASAPPPAENQPRDLQAAGDGGASASNDDAAGSDDDAAGSDDAGSDDDAAGSDDAADDDAADDSGPDDVGDAGPPPAAAGQSCTEWSDCGPWYADPNSGFDCAANACVCNADGNWDDACASIGGVWSDADCFCYVGAAPMPSEDADDWVADDEDDAYDDGSDDSYDDGSDDPRANRTCWWRWRETCDPDVWVEEGYVYECNGDECGYEWSNDGYWEPGDCDGYWLRRCDDGTEKRYG